ncbi:MAG: D-2-hydroxyacid dehydrogenase [Hyphomicrobiaceae bacterium]
MINILSLLDLAPEEATQIRAVSSEVELIEAGGLFDDEYRETWPACTVSRYLDTNTVNRGTRDERDLLLWKADIIYGGFPFPIDARTRAPNLKWFHQRSAGASNLQNGDLWNSSVVVTTSRGHTNSRAIAEYVVAGILHFAKSLDQAVQDRATGTLDHRAYRPRLVERKTICIVGTGGIGRQVGKLCAALGMRVVGTRRSPSVGEDLPEGFSALGAPDDLDQYLAESDYIAICCQWTPETTHLFNHDRLQKLKQGSILVNIARGEILDEQALASALESGRLRGVVLDVYEGEFERRPPLELWCDDRILITPHVSGLSDDRLLHGAIDIFCENLRAFLSRNPMRNVVDWKRGY